MNNNFKDSFLIGKQIYLRPYQPGDEELVARIENHPDPRSTLFYALPSTIQQQKDKIEKQLDDPNSIVLFVCSKESNQAIGQIALLRIDWVGRMAIFYLAIADKENWSKGYGSEATNLVVDYAFNTLNLNRIQLHVAVENTTAVKLYQKVGFKIEGTLREAMYHQGRYCDFYVMGLLKKEYESGAK